ncbi:hypothetical protein YPPY14_2505, partial [Yersinia pestis PY-14]
MLYGRIEIV